MGRITWRTGRSCSATKSSSAVLTPLRGPPSCDGVAQVLVQALTGLGELRAAGQQPPAAWGWRNSSGIRLRRVVEVAPPVGPADVVHDQERHRGARLARGLAEHAQLVVDGEPVVVAVDQRDVDRRQLRQHVVADVAMEDVATGEALGVLGRVEHRHRVDHVQLGVGAERVEHPDGRLAPQRADLDHALGPGCDAAPAPRLVSRTGTSRLPSLRDPQAGRRLRSCGPWSKHSRVIGLMRLVRRARRRDRRRGLRSVDGDAPPDADPAQRAGLHPGQPLEHRRPPVRGLGRSRRRPPTRAAAGGDGDEWTVSDLAELPGNPLAAPTADDEHNVYAIAVDGGRRRPRRRQHARRRAPLRPLAGGPELTGWEAGPGAERLGKRHLPGLHGAARRHPAVLATRRRLRRGRRRRRRARAGSAGAGDRSGSCSTAPPSGESPYLHHIAVDPGTGTIHMMFEWRATPERSTTN